MDAATTTWRRRKPTGTAFYIPAFLLMSAALLLASMLPVADCSCDRSSSFTKAAARTSSLLGLNAGKAAAYGTSQISQLPSSILSALLRSFLSPLLRSARVILFAFNEAVAQCEAVLLKVAASALRPLSVSVGQLPRLPRSTMAALTRSFLVPLLRSVRAAWSAFLTIVANCETLLLDATGSTLNSLIITPANAAVRGAGEALSKLVSSAVTGSLGLAQNTAALLTSPLGFLDTASAGVSKSVGPLRPERLDASETSKSKEGLETSNSMEGLVLKHLDVLEWLVAEAGVFAMESYLFGTSKAMWKTGLKLLVLKPVMIVVKDPILRLAFSFLSPFLTLLFLTAK